MSRILINNKQLLIADFESYQDIETAIVKHTLLNSCEFYLEQNGKLLSSTGVNIDRNGDVHCMLRIYGGKGGFGSMLRAIGAQIEKTTNREACRDLSGRRLRDINEEKRLKAWLEKQGEREREAEERKKRKIEKLLAVPKHEFKDTEYEESRSKLTEKVNDAVEEGFKKAQNAKQTSTKCTSKRKAETAQNKKDKKKKKYALWIGDDISSSDESNSDDEYPKSSSTTATKKDTEENTKSNVLVKEERR